MATRKTSSRSLIPGEGKETLEERRQRQAVEADAAARVQRLEDIKAAAHKKELAAKQAKAPVTLMAVYWTFCKRLKATPVKQWFQEEKGQFGGPPLTIKIESRFLDLDYSKIKKAMDGLDVRCELTRVKDMSYSHIALWGHKGQTIAFNVSMRRYKDKSVLFIFTPDIPEPVKSKKDTAVQDKKLSKKDSK